MLARLARAAFGYRLLTGAVLFGIGGGSPTAHAQAPLHTRRAELATHATIEIGTGAQEAVELNRVPSAEVDRLGQLWVPDEIAKQIRVFAPNGRLVRTVGAKGSGPGEFQQFLWLQALDDTMWVFDPRLSRLTPYGIATGQLLKSTRPSAVEARTFGLSSSGRLVARWSDLNGPSESKPLRIDIVQDQSTGPRTLASVVRNHPIRWARIYDRRQAPPPPEPNHGLQIDQIFDDAPLYQRGSAGRSIVLVERSGLQSPGFRIVEISTSGDTLSKRLYQAPLVPLTDKQVGAAIDSISRSVSDYTNPNFLASTSDIRAALFRPRFWPTVLDFHVGIDGSIWLLQPPSGHAGTQYWRVDKNGQTLPSVALDAGLRILRVSRDRVWVVKEDADGTPMIQIRNVTSVRR